MLTKVTIQLTGGMQINTIVEDDGLREIAAWQQRMDEPLELGAVFGHDEGESWKHGHDRKSPNLKPSSMKFNDKDGVEFWIPACHVGFIMCTPLPEVPPHLRPKP